MGDETLYILEKKIKMLC